MPPLPLTCMPVRLPALPLRLLRHPALKASAPVAPHARHLSQLSACAPASRQSQRPAPATRLFCTMAQYSTSAAAPGSAPVTQIGTHDQYHTDGIDAASLSASPIAQFNKWFKEAIDAEDVPEPEAMTVCTVSIPDAEPGAAAAEAEAGPVHSAWRGASTRSAPRPSARVVLLKRVDPAGFVFYSNYTSRKGCELARNPWISATFYWRAQHRSVRICGKAERLSKEESQAYFDSRPVGSRIGARASPQSQVIHGRDELEQRVRDEEMRWNVPGAAGLDGEEAKFPDAKVEVPDYWGGYRIVPDEVEFWCGRNNRLHDRFRYTRPDISKEADSDEWTIERLAP